VSKRTIEQKGDDMLAKSFETDSSQSVSHEKKQGRSVRWFFQIGALAAIVGSLLGLVGNLIHPATMGLDANGVAHVIAHSEAWTAIHLIIVVGLIFMLGGLVAICSSIKGGLAGTLAQLGYVAVIAGITVGLITVILDGVGAKHIADAWAAAPTDEKAAALRILQAEEILNFALASLFNILFAGVTFILLGLAVALSQVYPRWLGWIVVVAGLGSIVAGLIQANAGESTSVTQILTIIFPTILTLWTAVMGVLLFRKASSLDSDRSSGSMPTWTASWSSTMR
jgi:hypothetical protein